MLFGKNCTEVLQVVVDKEANFEELRMIQFRVRNFVFGMTCGCISSVNKSERFLLDPPNQVNLKHEMHVTNTKNSVPASHSTKFVSTTKISHSTFILRNVRNPS
jgi:hypothetical protein